MAERKNGRGPDSEEMINRWFEEKYLPNNVLAIGEPYHSEEVFCYLVKGEKADMLIDTGMGIGSIASFVCEHRNPFGQLIIVNTHWHFDHIGGNEDFERHAIFVPNGGNEAALIRKGWTHKQLQKYYFEEGFGPGKIPEAFDPSTFEIPPVDNVLPRIDDTWSIDLGGRVVRAIETPGHTPGGVTFFDETNGLLFPADMLYEGPLYAFEKESSPDDYFESLKKIKELYGDKIKTIHPGHNYPENTLEPDLLDEAIALFEKARNGNLPDCAAEFPHTSEYQQSGISKRTGKSRRLKLIVSNKYVCSNKSSK